MNKAVAFSKTVSQYLSRIIRNQFIDYHKIKAIYLKYSNGV